jgi:DNA-directed RNA polymerase specialized sigma24 family protein
MNAIVAQKNEQLQLDLFGSADRLPRRPYCSDDLSTGLRIRSLAQALTKPYIQLNPPHLRVWSIFDVDREGAAFSWEQANLPPPSWAAINRENGHAHLVWGLAAPVLVDGQNMRLAPLRYLCAVEAAFRAKLDADSGYSGLITKNPTHPLWRLLRGPRIDYELSELADYVDLPRHLPKRKPEEVGLGRNVTLFNWLRHFAYRHIRHYRSGVRNYVIWQAYLNSKALERNGDFQYPLDSREVWYIVKSVAKWTWRRFDIEASDRRFRDLQAARGRASGEARRAVNEDKRASARLMRAQGMTQQAIADALGVTQQTVSKWLHN